MISNESSRRAAVQVGSTALLADEGTSATAWQRWQLLALLGAAVLFLLLTYRSAATERPGVDEGFFAGPAYTLATKGFMGSTVIESTALPNIHRYTYWIMPAHPVLQAGWYKLWGFSLVKMRMLSAVWGLVLAGAMMTILRRLGCDRTTSVLVFLLLTTDYLMLIGSSSGRMDVMCAALGFAGIAAYLHWRERNLGWAMLLGQTCVVLSGLTHPNGLIGWLGLTFLILRLDWRRLRLNHLLLGLVPYVVFGGMWGLYIAQDRESFVAQLRANASTGNRWQGIQHPLEAIWREVRLRYLVAYGLGTHNAGHAGPIYLKALALAAYVGAVLLAVITRPLRQNRAMQIVLSVLAIYVLFLTIWDGQKTYYYLVHVIPLYAAVLAMVARFLLDRGGWWRWAVPAGLAGLMLLQAGGLLYRSRQDTYGRLYAPVITYLQKRALPQHRVVMASSAFGFGLQFADELVDDCRLGYYSGRKPDFVVMDQEFETTTQDFAVTQPDLYRHITTLLNQEFTTVYANPGCKIYGRRSLGAP